MRTRHRNKTELLATRGRKNLSLSGCFFFCISSPVDQNGAIVDKPRLWGSGKQGGLWYCPTPPPLAEPKYYIMQYVVSYSYPEVRSISNIMVSRTKPSSSLGTPLKRLKRTMHRLSQWPRSTCKTLPKPGWLLFWWGWSERNGWLFRLKTWEFP